MLYNQKQEQEFKERILVLQQQQASEQKTLDKLLEQTADYRKLISSLKLEVNALESHKYDIEQILVIIENNLKNNRDIFYDVTGKQIELIQEYADRINKYLIIAEHNQNGTLIDFDGQNQKIKSILNDKRKEITELEGKIKKLLADREKIELENAKIIKQLDKKQSKLDKKDNVLKQKEKRLKLKEKRLNKLALSIKQKNDE